MVLPSVIFFWSDMTGEVVERWFATRVVLPRAADVAVAVDTEVRGGAMVEDLFKRRDMRLSLDEMV